MPQMMSNQYLGAAADVWVDIKFDKVVSIDTAGAKAGTDANEVPPVGY